MLQAADELKRIAVHPPYSSLAQLVLKFALQDRRISCVFPGAKSPEQCKANMAIAELPELPTDVVETLEQYEMEDAANP